MPIINLPEINEKGILPAFSGTLLANSWVDHSGEYVTQTINVPNMTSSRIPVVALVTTAGEKDDDLMTEWGHIYRVESGNGTLMFYSDESPEINLNIMGYAYKEEY